MRYNSPILWNYDQPVSNALIKEIMRVMISNKPEETKFFDPQFQPYSQIDHLAKDISEMIDKHGIPDYVILQYAEASPNKEKCLEIVHKVRGTLILIGELG